MKKILAIVTICMLFISSVPLRTLAATPVQDMRAVWIATVFNLDYPSAKNNITAQKEEYIKKLDALKEIGINAVVVQVRPKADALYKSSINPWSDVLTGIQGQDPGYDPMTFMIEEAHKRAMTFHAWLNPYRVTTKGVDLSALSSDHPARNNPDWVLSYNNALYYNPELQQVKKHIVDTVKEIVQNYNVDGIHFDDYFYPSNYPLPAGESKDGSVANQRRQHINDMVSQVSSAIKSLDKNIQFGISPIGIWKNNTSDITGSSTGGNESYYAVAGDTRTWIKNEWIDYVVPQIYWETGHKLADYETLVKWWSNEVEGTQVKLYIGQGIYRDVVATQIDKQLKINQTYERVKGSFYYSIKDLLANRSGCQDKIKAFNESFPISNALIPQTQVVKASTTRMASSIKKGVVTGNVLNMRSGNGIQHAIITKLSKGTKVEVLNSQSGWYQVKLSNGQVGWVSDQFIAIDQSSTNTSTVSQMTTATVITSTLNVRSGASTNHTVVTKLSKGTKVNILQTQSTWCRIKLANGQEGWVSRNFIQ